MPKIHSKPPRAPAARKADRNADEGAPSVKEETSGSPLLAAGAAATTARIGERLEHALPKIVRVDKWQPTAFAKRVSSAVKRNNPAVWRAGRLLKTPLIGLGGVGATIEALFSIPRNVGAYLRGEQSGPTAAAQVSRDTAIGYGTGVVAGVATREAARGVALAGSRLGFFWGGAPAGAALAPGPWFVGTVAGTAAGLMASKIAHNPAMVREWSQRHPAAAGSDRGAAAKAGAAARYVGERFWEGAEAVLRTEGTSASGFAARARSAIMGRAPTINRVTGYLRRPATGPGAIGAAVEAMLSIPRNVRAARRGKKGVAKAAVHVAKDAAIGYGAAAAAAVVAKEATKAVVTAGTRLGFSWGVVQGSVIRAGGPWVIGALAGATIGMMVVKLAHKVVDAPLGDA